MEISKNTKVVTLTKEEMFTAVQDYLTKNDINGEVTDVSKVEVDRAEMFERYPNYEFVGLKVTVKS